jgi:hypothetical protein
MVGYSFSVLNGNASDFACLLSDSTEELNFIDGHNRFLSCNYLSPNKKKG